MQQVTPPRRDPAPSRTAYKIQRLWLTPSFRALTRVGLPVFAVAVGVGGYFADATHREDLGNKIAEIRRSIQERPEFMVKVMAIDGASDGLSEDIREVVPVDFPVSSFDLDLEQMRVQIQELDAVASARIQIRTGGVLQVDVDERLPAVLWRTRDGITALDETGHIVAPVLGRADFPNLPLIAGEGAERVVPEALAILAAAGPLTDRLRGLVRMGERRWDLVLDRDQRILLPEQSAVAALERVIFLNEAQDMLARDLVAVDMRNKNRPTIRLSGAAVDEVRKIKATELGVEN